MHTVHCKLKIHILDIRYYMLYMQYSRLVFVRQFAKYVISLVPVTLNYKESGKQFCFAISKSMVMGK